MRAVLIGRTFGIETKTPEEIARQVRADRGDGIHGVKFDQDARQFYETSNLEGASEHMCRECRVKINRTIKVASAF